MRSGDPPIRKPNFFIVGAPKCGTTSMANYLSWHPRVFVSAVKEPHYFARHTWRNPNDRLIPSYRNSLELYLKQFQDMPDDCLATGEASVRYLMHRKSLEEIAEFTPDARIIAMLRNPVDLAYSLHSELLKHYLEDVEDFETAWDLQSERAAGRRIPPGAETLDLLQYSAAASLGAQVEQLFEIFPREQILLIFFDDFVRDTGTAYRQVLEHLGVPDNGQTEFPVVNQNGEVQRSLLLKLMKEQHWLRYLSGRLKHLLGVESWRIAERLQKKNLVIKPRPPLRPELREMLTAHFDADTAKLQVLTGRDLSRWMGPTRQPVAHEPEECETPR
jgi:hypothetical protein